MEYYKQGSLLDYMKSRQEKFSETELISISLQIAKGMAFLENHQVLHRDLAARNIFIDDASHIKIGDFGMSREAAGKGEYRNTDAQVPIRWTAPEIFDSSPFTSKADVWSYSVLLWELFSYGEHPYGSMKTWDIISYIRDGRRLQKLETIPEDIWKLMDRCWESDPEKRPTFAEIVGCLKVLTGEADENDSNDNGYQTISQLRETTYNKTPTSIGSREDSPYTSVTQKSNKPKTETIDADIKEKSHDLVSPLDEMYQKQPLVESDSEEQIGMTKVSEYSFSEDSSVFPTDKAKNMSSTSKYTFSDSD